MAHLKHEQFNHDILLYEKTILQDSRIVIRMKCKTLEIGDTFETFSDSKPTTYRCVEFHRGKTSNGLTMYYSIFEIIKD